MPNFLDRLIQTSRPVEPAVKPRMASRYESAGPEPTFADLLIEEPGTTAVLPSEVPTSRRSEDSPTAPEPVIMRRPPAAHPAAVTEPADRLAPERPTQPVRRSMRLAREDESPVSPPEPDRSHEPRRDPPRRLPPEPVDTPPLSERTTQPAVAARAEVAAGARDVRPSPVVVAAPSPVIVPATRPVPASASVEERPRRRAEVRATDSSEESLRERIAGRRQRARPQAEGRDDLTAAFASPPSRAEGDDAPVIEVTIGRVEVRATVPPAAGPKSPPRGPALGLDEYLRRRKEGRS